MKAEDLPDERDRKHAEKAERRNRASTHRRRSGWRWPEPPVDAALPRNPDKWIEREFQGKDDEDEND